MFEKSKEFVATHKQAILNTAAVVSVAVISPAAFAEAGAGAFDPAASANAVATTLVTYISGIVAAAFVVLTAKVGASASIGLVKSLIGQAAS
ncbi:hypothetical protein IHE26_07345 [Plesiomonas shigelloides]|uniref:hypothetical protein n=1 Tax=Plesiomonas shigelloides TaxID=703 RepID=UPI001782E069|nr:hypothetical protein [Plesiomonas shigelloides]QOH81065.1 hypothetical protein IHE26_07345 [Plesiomonas shigelloides]